MLDKTGNVALDRGRANQLERDGFLHLEHVVPAERVGEVMALAQQVKPGDNLHNTKLFSVLLEELRINQLMQSLMNQPIYYFGWASVMNGLKPAVAHLHDDAKGSKIPADGKPDLYFQALMRPYDPVKHEPWPIYRLFIYFNDHTKHSGGTKVRRGSWKRYELLTKKGLKLLLRGKWKHVSWPFFGYVNPMVKPGDAVLFNLRSRHSGYFVRLRGPLKNFALPPRLDNILKGLLLGSKFGRAILNTTAYPMPDTRTSVAIDFCIDNDWARGFQANRILNPGNEAYRGQIFDCNDPAFVTRLQAVGLPILNSPALPAVEKFLKAS